MANLLYTCDANTSQNDFSLKSSNSLPILFRLDYTYSLNLVLSSSYWSHKSPLCLIKSYNKFIGLPYPVHQCRILPIYEVPFDALVLLPNISFNLGIDKGSPLANQQFNYAINTHYKDWYHLLTDSSKLTEQGCIGSAVWIPRVNVVLNCKMPPASSVFTGEALAILEALSLIESHQLNNSVIFSDSKSCLQSILNNPFKTKFYSQN